METEIFEDRPSFLIGAWRNVLFYFGGTQSTVETYQRVQGWLEDLARRHEEGVVFLRWIPFGSIAPNPDARAQASKAFETLGAKLQGFVTILEGDGFWASGARSVLLEISMAGNLKAPTKVAHSTNEAAQWLVDHLRPAVGLDELNEILSKLRNRAIDNSPAVASEE